MTEPLEDLTASQLFRVHATFGVPLMVAPDTLLRYAALLDRHEAECLDVLERAREHRDEARWWAISMSIVGGASVAANLGILWWLA